MADNRRRLLTGRPPIVPLSSPNPPLGPDSGRVRTEQAALLTYTPQEHGYDLVMVIYLHLPADQRRAVIRKAASAVAPNGWLLIVGR